MIDIEPLLLTAKLAFITTIVLLVIGIPVAHWFSFTRFRFKPALEAIITLPLVLPPTVLGFYLLLAFSPENAVGKFLHHYFNIRLVFTFGGLVVASVIYSLPFMVNPILAGLKGLPRSLQEASITLGKSGFITLIKILLPNIRVSILTGVIMTFAHCTGEFGVVLMVGGSIPKETRVASVALFEQVQNMNYHTANIYAAILIFFSFSVLLAVYLLNDKFRKTHIL